MKLQFHSVDRIDELYAGGLVHLCLGELLLSVSEVFSKIVSELVEKAQFLFAAVNWLISFFDQVFVDDDVFVHEFNEPISIQNWLHAAHQLAILIFNLDFIKAFQFLIKVQIISISYQR